MSQVADRPSPSQHRNKGTGDEHETHQENPPTTSRPKLRRARKDQRSRSRPKRYAFVEDDARETKEPIRRPKSAISSRSVGPIPQATQQQYYIPPDPRAYHQGFYPPRYQVPPSGYTFPSSQPAAQTNQARLVMQPPGYFNPNAAGYGHQQQHYSAYGPLAPPARPYAPSLPAFRPPPVRRGPPTPLERENHELKKELENIRLVQERQKKDKDRADRAKFKAAKQASEREAVKKEVLKDLRPMLDQYVQAAWRQRTLAIQDTFASSGRSVPRSKPAYEQRELQTPRRSSQRTLLSERESNLNPTFEDFNQFLEQRRYQEGQWSPTTPALNGGAFVEQGSYLPPAQPVPNPMIDPSLQIQIETTVASLIPGLLQQRQRDAPSRRDYAAEAADLGNQILQPWARGQATKHEEVSTSNNPNPVRGQMRASSAYMSTAGTTNGEASNRGRARRKSKGKKSSTSSKGRGGNLQEVTAEDYPGADVEFEMIPGRKPAPYGAGYPGLFVPDPPWRSGVLQ